jgi:hypothetical protein
VNGSNFIQGSSVQWNSSSLATTYISATQLTAQVPAANLTAGTASVTVYNPTPDGGTSTAQSFTISNSNPAPVLSSISPTSAFAVGTSFTLTVNGSNFVSGSMSVVRWNGNNLATTYVSATQLMAQVPAADISAAGTASVTVFNTTPGGGTSTAQTFTINPVLPSPTITNLNPNIATEGEPAFTLTVNGANFVTGATVYWGTTALDTTVVSAAQITAVVPASLIATAGTADVTVTTGGHVGSIGFHHRCRLVR